MIVRMIVLGERETVSDRSLAIVAPAEVRSQIAMKASFALAEVQAVQLRNPVAVKMAQDWREVDMPIVEPGTEVRTHSTVVDHISSLMTTAAMKLTEQAVEAAARSCTAHRKDTNNLQDFWAGQADSVWVFFPEQGVGESHMTMLEVVTPAEV